MDYDKIKRLMDDMGESKLTAITIELPDGTKVSMKKGGKAPKVENIIKEDLIQVVEKGTATDCKIEGKTIAGKTGTAEIKENQEDKNGEEIGWFNCFDDKDLLVVSMVQNVKQKGGSHYVVKKVRNMFE